MSDLDVATVEELNPEGSMDVQNMRNLGMGWAWQAISVLTPFCLETLFEVFHLYTLCIARPSSSEPTDLEI